ncbi:MAG: hypothetical protein JXA25_05835 [Anaerolineales bacterium]|nr:hypothetical protein [Anaerolineales bacterium]
MKNRKILLGTAFLFVFLILSACTPAATIEEAPPATCAIVWTPYQASGNNYLGVKDGGDCVNAFALIVDFTEPVESVSLSFSGASKPYIMEVYDESGTLLDIKLQEAQFNNGDGTLFGIGYSSPSANIDRVQFSGPQGGPKVVIAVREIVFSRAGTESSYNFDTFPDGTVIAGNTQDTEGVEWQSLTGNEFADWGFMVSTDLDER